MDTRMEWKTIRKYAKMIGKYFFRVFKLILKMAKAKQLLFVLGGGGGFKRNSMFLQKLVLITASYDLR